MSLPARAKGRAAPTLLFRAKLQPPNSDPAQIEAILRPFRFTSLVAGSAMSQGEALRLAEESKAGWWEKNQERFAPPQG